MKFQIINKKTNKAVNLNAFDKIYCQFTGEQVDELVYNNWYSAINGAIEIFLMAISNMNVKSLLSVLFLISIKHRNVSIL